MTDTQAVRTDVVPGDGAVELAPNGEPYKLVRPRLTNQGGLGGSIDMRVPANIIDRTRREARQRAYANSTIEAATIKATDLACWDRVRAQEAQVIQQSAAFLERNEGRVAQSLSYMDQLEDIKQRLRNGEDTQTVAKDFRKLERTIRSREVSVMRGLAKQSETLAAKIADPVANAQRILSRMPRDFWQPLPLQKYM